MKPLRLALLLCVLVLLSGCAPTRAVTVKPFPTATFCKANKHVWVGDDDKFTEKTATLIEGNNLSRAPICGKPKPYVNK